MGEHQPDEPRACHREVRRENWRIEIEPWRRPFVGESNQDAHREMARELQSFLSDHTAWRGISVHPACDVVSICSVCGEEWEPVLGFEIGDAEEGYVPDRLYCPHCREEVKEDRDG